MKVLRRYLGGFAALFLVLGLFGPKATHAATSPSLGNAATFSILSGTTVTNSGNTTISGDVGISPAGGGGATGFGTVTLGGTLHDSDILAANAQTDKNTAYGILAANACGADGGTDYGGIIKSLNGLTLPPGVYCANEFDLSGTLTLNGTASDVWIFKSASSLVVSGGASAKVVFTGGGLPCNVWWRVVSSATFDAGSSLVGNILADTSITFANGASLNGRALARTAAVTLVGNSITGPTCTAPAVPAVSVPGSGGSNYNTLTVIKQVINDNSGKALYNDFPLFVNGNQVSSGQSVSLAPGSYTVTETNLPGYTQSFTGNCDASGKVDLGGYNSQSAVCTVVNNDIGAPAVAIIPPLIDVVKVPSPLALPAGPGSVTYTYSVTNPGTVPLTDVGLVGDTCSPIVLSSGDTNGDSKLDVNETWVYHCTKTLTQTTKNTVVATGHANGLTAIHVASAVVVVGSPVVPPLIHITKIPSPLALPAGAGTVSYTMKVTNPGTVALSNVSVTDDKCSSVKYQYGDSNGDSKLDTNEVWTYTCSARVSKTTTDTATATGSANGLTATDFALATVVVAIPKLPNTGVAPFEHNFPWGIVASVSAVAVLALIFVATKKQMV